jgi:hypothetical protein
MVSNGKVIDELERMWKEAVLTQSSYFPQFGVCEKYHGETESGGVAAFNVSLGLCIVLLSRRAYRQTCEKSQIWRCIIKGADKSFAL